jgi:hypothetical protein
MLSLLLDNSNAHDPQYLVKFALFAELVPRPLLKKWEEKIGLWLQSLKQESLTQIVCCELLSRSLIDSDVLAFLIQCCLVTT